MAVSFRSRSSRLPGVNCVLLIGLFVVLWIAGGASRADVPGQVLVRATAWLALIISILAGARPDWRTARPAVFILLATLVLVCVQLLPLPPAIWQALPGRARFVEAAVLLGQSQPWRPLAIVPDAAVNAAGALIVPAGVLWLSLGMTATEREWLPLMLLVLVVLTALVGALQFTGMRLGNPLINYSPGEVSGTFANRNHFAVFVALGCALAPAWAFSGERQIGWRAPVALGLIPFFVLVILASGSRAGILLATLGTMIGLLLSRRGLKRVLARGPRWLFPVFMAGMVGVIAIFVLLSVAAGRAMSLQRMFAMDTGHDLRARALPSVIAMIRTYFPAGSGFGGFDPLFRLHEPFALLKPTYFNHAHNDFAEIVLDGGLPAIVLLVVALGWWASAGMRAWCTSGASLSRLGFSLLLLILLASVVDFPARTPLMMMVVVIAALWLGDPTAGLVSRRMTR